MISTHLNPHSPTMARGEAEFIGSRVYRYGGLGLIIGDVNYLTPDAAPDWSTAQPYNIGARGIRTPDGIDVRTDVVAALAGMGLSDIAAYVAERDGRPDLLGPSAIDGVRVDQAWVTQALKPAVVDYEVISAQDLSAHDAIVLTIDLPLAGTARPWV